MSLIRFDGDSVRGPSPSIWAGIIDWVRGSLATAIGTSDFEDFAPFLGASETSTTTDPLPTGGTQITSLAATPTVSILTTERGGVIRVTEGAAADECVGVAREIYYTLGDSPILAVGARIDQNADANDPQAFVGFSDVANPDDVFASGVIAASSNQDTIGLRWNVDETIDIVAVDDGTLTVLKDDIGVTLERTDGFARLELRVEKVTTAVYRLVPAVNGIVARSGIVNVLATLLPENPMRPVVASTVDDTTAPSLDLDWIYSGEK